MDSFQFTRYRAFELLLSSWLWLDIRWRWWCSQVSLEESEVMILTWTWMFLQWESVASVLLYKFTSVMVWMHNSMSATLQNFSAILQMYIYSTWNLSPVEHSLFTVANEMFTLREVWRRFLDWHPFHMNHFQGLTNNYCLISIH